MCGLGQGEGEGERRHDPPPPPPPPGGLESLGLRAPHTSPSDLRFGSAQVWINPQIAWLSEDFNWAWEGCQSMPGMRGWIKRPRAIVLKGYGEDGEAKERQFEANFCFFGFFFF